MVIRGRFFYNQVFEVWDVDGRLHVAREPPDDEWDHDPFVLLISSLHR